METKIRGATKDDLGFILATLPRSLRYGSTFWETTDNSRFHKNTFELVRQIALNPSISLRILCDEQEPAVILSYAILSLGEANRALVYAYTKPPFRKQGFIKLLVADAHITQVAYSTVKLMSTLKRNKLELNPWIITDILKGDT